MTLRPVDRLEIRVLVDNVSDQLSTNPVGVDSELVSLRRAGLEEWGGEGICCAHFGLSLHATAHAGDTRQTLLFDAGPEGYAVERNSARLGIDMGEVEEVVLSHGHWDHAGGLTRALALIRAGNGGRPVPLHLHPGMFRRRGMRLPDGEVLPFRPVPGIDELTEAGADVRCGTEPRLLLDDMFWVSGEIPRVTSFERGFAAHVCESESADDWEPDPLIMDERLLAVNVRDRGIVVFSACSHAGAVNVLTHANETFTRAPLHAVIGGLHLSGPAQEPAIAETVAGLAELDLSRIAPAHCTGWRAVNALVREFGEDVVVPSAVGKRYVF